MEKIKEEDLEIFEDKEILKIEADVLKELNALIENTDSVLEIKTQEHHVLELRISSHAMEGSPYAPADWDPFLLFDKLDLPESIRKLEKLQILVVENCINTIPHDIFDSLPDVRVLRLTRGDDYQEHYRGTKFKIPTSLSKLSNLYSLELSGLALTSFPEEIIHLKSLKELGLSSNYIKEIPTEVGELKRLKKIDLSSNALISLPSTIGKLTKLKHFTLFQNSLLSLSKEFIGLKSLKY